MSPSLWRPAVRTGVEWNFDKAVGNSDPKMADTPCKSIPSTGSISREICSQADTPQRRAITAGHVWPKGRTCQRFGFRILRVFAI